MKRKIDEYYELDPSERKLALLNLLSAVMEVLARNNLTFYAYYGTLLGAVRHQGFIPWDDDVDLAMPRADYDRLKDIDWSRSGLLLISPQTMKHCPYPFAKVSDSNFHLVEEIDHPRITLGLNVDIFPIDVVNMSSLRIRQRIIFLINNIISAKVTSLHMTRSIHKNLLLFLVKKATFFIQVGCLTRAVDRLAAQSHLVGDIMGNRSGPYGLREFVPSDYFVGLRTLEFHGLDIPVPVGYKSILKSVYGDYMKLPPMEKRVSHHSNRLYKRARVSGE